MTEPQQPDRQPWSEADLPVLTDVDDDTAATVEGVEIPDFDFSAELDDIKSRLGTGGEAGLEFPPELLLEDVVPDVPVVASGVALDFGDVPSLDLESYAATPVQDPAQPPRDFEFEFEPPVAMPSGTSDDGGFDAPPPGAELHPMPVDETALTANAPVERDDTPEPLPAAVADTSTMPADLAAFDLAEIPELVLEDAPENAEAAASVNEEPLAEATGTDVPAPEALPVDAAADLDALDLVDIPELELEDTQTDAVVDAPVNEEPLPELAETDLSVPVAFPVDEPTDIPELSLADALPNEEVALNAEADRLPVSIVEEVAPEDLSADTSLPPIDVQDIPDLSLADVLTDAPDEIAAAEDAAAAEAGTQEEAKTPATVGMPSPVPPADEPAVLAESPQEEPVNAYPAQAEAAMPPSPESAETVAPTQEEPAEALAAETLAGPDLVAGETSPPSVAAAAPDAVAPAMATASASGDESVAVDAAAEAGFELTDTQESAGAEVAAQESEPLTAIALEPAVRSISLDSLPRGVLGGGLGPDAAVAEEPPAPSVQDLIRAAEKTLAEERLRQAMQQARDEADASAVVTDDVVAPPEVLSLPPEPDASPAVIESKPSSIGAAPQGEPHRPVEIINVAGLASNPAPQSYGNLPPVRKSYVTLVDEAMLIDSLYDKILPRMKVELSLWLQDALDHQAKQMLSGVMHQLKEDYEMLFSETLRESLRQAIAEMGREDRGERF
jgi:hypothetical protein